MKFRTRSVVIEAVRWTGENRAQVTEFVGCGNGAVEGEAVMRAWEVAGRLTVGDWITRDETPSLLRLCRIHRPDDFVATYEAVERD